MYQQYVSQKENNVTHSSVSAVKPKTIYTEEIQFNQMLQAEIVHLREQNEAEGHDQPQSEENQAMQQIQGVDYAVRLDEQAFWKSESY